MGEGSKVGRRALKGCALLLFAVAALTPAAGLTLLGMVGLAIHDFGDREFCTESSEVIVEAASRGDRTEVESLLDRGVKANTTDTRGRTSLWCAVENRHDDVATLLLDRGADPDGNAGFRPLVRVAGHDDATVARKLIEHGAHLDLPAEADTIELPGPNRVGDRSLFSAASSGAPDTISLLLDEGASVDGVERARPLVAAAARPDGRAAEVLLRRGARLDLPSHFTVSLIPWELESPDRLPVTVGGEALDAASREGSVETVGRLLELGVDPNVKSSMGPLLLATFGQRHGAMQRLLDGGADPNMGRVGGIRLFVSIDSVRSAQVREFLRWRAARDLDGLNPNRPQVPSEPGGPPAPAFGQGDEVPPLTVAVAQQDPIAVAILLRAGADPNKPAAVNVTALYLAAIDCNADVARQLLAAGADPESPGLVVSTATIPPTSPPPTSFLVAYPVPPTPCAEVLALLRPA